MKYKIDKEDRENLKFIKIQRGWAREMTDSELIRQIIKNCADASL